MTGLGSRTSILIDVIVQRSFEGTVARFMSAWRSLSRVMLRIIIRSGEVVYTEVTGRMVMVRCIWMRDVVMAILDILQVMLFDRV